MRTMLLLKYIYKTILKFIIFKASIKFNSQHYISSFKNRFYGKTANAPEFSKLLHCLTFHMCLIVTVLLAAKHYCLLTFGIVLKKREREEPVY